MTAPIAVAGGAATATALVLPAGLAVAGWLGVGRQLARIENAVNWWIGDWWRFGHRYGTRKALVTAEDWTGPSFQTCMNAASVCRTFTTSRRREVLSFSHHQAVLGLPGRQIQELLDWAAAPLAEGKRVRSVMALWAERQRRHDRTALAALAAAPVRVSGPPPSLPLSGPGSCPRLTGDPGHAAWAAAIG
jgi:hypothetical protein